MTDWPVKTLGEVALVGAGNSAPQDKELFKDGMHRFVRTSDVGQVRIGRLGESADLLNDAGAEGLREFRAGVTLIPKSGASTFLNHRVQLTKPCFVSSHLAVVDSNPEVMDDTFMFYFLQTVRSQDLIQDQSYPSLNLPAISGINILVPPLEEQKRLVALLDAATERVTELTLCYEQARTHANNLFTSALRETLASNPDWPVKTLGEVALVGAGNSAPQDKELFKDGMHRFVRTSDVGQVRIGRLGESADLLNDAGAEGLREFRAGVTLIPKSGASTFLNHRVQLTKPCFVSSHLAVVDSNPEVMDDTFMFYFLQTVRSQDLIQDQSYPSLNLPAISGINILVPPLEEQKKIVERLDSMRAKTSEMVAAYDAKLTAVKNLRQSILESAFEGKL